LMARDVELAEITAGCFKNEATFVHAVEELERELKGDPTAGYTQEYVSRFGKRCAMHERVAKRWPPHTAVAAYLRSRDTVTTKAIAECNTFEDQLDLVDSLPGWHRIHENDATDGSFWEALTGILELIYFGVDPAKVCLSVKFNFRQIQFPSNSIYNTLTFL
jgi:hypothetical protein